MTSSRMLRPLALLALLVCGFSPRASFADEAARAQTLPVLRLGGGFLYRDGDGQLGRVDVGAGARFPLHTGAQLFWLRVEGLYSITPLATTAEHAITAQAALIWDHDIWGIGPLVGLVAQGPGAQVVALTGRFGAQLSLFSGILGLEAAEQPRFTSRTVSGVSLGLFVDVGILFADRGHKAAEPVMVPVELPPESN